jgi:hypothetical protein
VARTPVIRAGRPLSRPAAPGSGGCGLPRWVARACARRLCVPAPRGALTTFGYQLRTRAGTRTGNRPRPRYPQAVLSHATALLRPRPRPRGRLPGPGRPRLITTWHGRGRQRDSASCPSRCAGLVRGGGPAAAWCTIGWGCEVGGGRSSVPVPVDRASPADLMQLATDVGPAPMPWAPCWSLAPGQASPRTRFRIYSVRHSFVVAYALTFSQRLSRDHFVLE